MNQICEVEYANWIKQSVIADCLRDLSTDCNAQQVNLEIIEQYLSIIKTKASQLKKHDVLDRLFTNGLLTA